MKYTAELRKSNTFFKGLSNFFESVWFPVIIAVLGVFSATNGISVYVPVFYVMTALILLALFSSSSLRVCFVPLLMLYYTIGSDVGYDEASDIGIAYNNVLDSFETAGLIQMLICGLVIVAGIVLKLFTSGAMANCLGKRYREITGKKSPFFGRFGIGLLAFSVLLLFNGAFSAYWDISDILFGLLEMAGFVVVYFLCLIIVRSDEIRLLEPSQAKERKGFKKFLSKVFFKPDMVTYICFVLACLGVMVSAEVIVLLAKIHNSYFVFEDGVFVGINRTWGFFSWGIFNMAGAVLAASLVGILLVAYRTKSKAVSMLMFFVGLFVYAVIFVTNCRNAMIVGAVVFLVMLFFGCISGKKKLWFCLLAFMTLCGLVFGFQFALDYCGGMDGFKELLDSLFRTTNFGEDRFVLWQDGIADFVNNPIFGAGFADGGYIEAEHTNMFSNMYHNIGVELLGACGAVGAAGFLFHLKDCFIAFFKRFSVGKMLALLFPVVIIVMSLADNYFWYLNIQLIYVAGLSMVDFLLSTSPEKS